MSAIVRHDLTDTQWQLLFSLLTPAPCRGRPRRYLVGSLVDGSAIAPGRAALGATSPNGTGRGGGCTRCSRAGNWWGCGSASRLHWSLPRTPAASLAWQVLIESTTARAHIHAAGARKDSVNLVAGQADHHGLGRCRGGFCTKVHLATDQHQGVLSFLLTPGQCGHSPEMVAVLEGIAVARPGPGRPRTRPDRVLADKAYSSRANRANRAHQAYLAYLAKRGIRATIPVPADRANHRQRRGPPGGRPPAFDEVNYRDRHAVECGINNLKHHRAMATRYDKLGLRHAATVRVAVIDHWLRRLS